MSNKERFAIAIAAPIVRHAGGDERLLGGGLDAARAARLLDVLCGIKTADDARALLQQFVAYGQRAEWKQYAMYAGTSWNPDPHDHSVVRKAAWALAHKGELGERGLVALDAMRVAAIAGWAHAAALFSHDAALAAIGTTLLCEVANRHTSWDEVSAQLRLAYQFIDGAVAPDVEAALAGLTGGDGVWRETPWPTAAELAPEGEEEEEEEGDEEEEEDEEEVEDDGTTTGPLTMLSLYSTVDCPGCGLPVSLTGLCASARCLRCATEIAMAPDDWGYQFSRGARNARAGIENDPYGNDFGNRFFSRTEVRRATAIACSCGAELPAPTAAGELACACGLRHTVRDADDAARAIATRARLIVELARATPTRFACAACRAPVPGGDGPIARCPSCAARTFVGPSYPRRLATYVLFAW